MAADSSKLDVLVIGLGAVGALYSYALERSGKARVTAVARSNAAIVRERGITVDSAKHGDDHFRPDRVVSSVGEALDRTYRFVLVTTKALPDVSPTADLLAPLFVNGQGPTVALLQNGLGIEQPVAEAFPEAEVLSAILWIGVNLIENGTKLTQGTLDRIVLGLYTGSDTGAASMDDPRTRAGLASAELLGSLLRAGGSEVEAVSPEKLVAARWGKNLWNLSLSTFCALTRTSVTDILAEDVIGSTLPVVRRVMLEMSYVARSCGVTDAMLPLSLIDTTITMTVKTYAPDRTRSPNFKPSMLLDIEAGRPIELEPIVGSVIDRARRIGLETPRLDMLYSLLAVHQSQFRARKAAASSDDEDTRAPRAPGQPTNGTTAGGEPIRRRSVAGPRAPGLSAMIRATPPLESPALDMTSPTRKRDKALGRPVGLDYASPPL